MNNARFSRDVMADTPEIPSVGAALKTAREAAGLTLGAVADRLKLSIRRLEAIEQDDFVTLSGGTFVRGLVRSYARFLQIDDGPLLRALEPIYPSTAAETVTLQAERAQSTLVKSIVIVDQVSVSWKSRAAVLAVGLMLLGAGVLWAHYTFSTRVHDAQQDAVLVPSGPVAAMPAPGSSRLAATAVPITAGSTRAEPNETSSQIILHTTEAAWVSVEDAMGQRLLYRTLQKGDQKTLHGKPPFKLIVGNAYHVRVQYNGQEVDFSDKIRGTTARFELK